MRPRAQPGAPFAPAANARKKVLPRVPLKGPRFEREIVVLTRRNRVLAQHVRELIDGVLFS